MEKVKVRSVAVSRIARLIKENKITASEFAKSCGLVPGNITDWKTGRSKPSAKALRKIAKIYKVQLEWLTGDSKYRTKEEEFRELYRNKEVSINERFTTN